MKYSRFPALMCFLLCAASAGAEPIQLMYLPSGQPPITIKREGQMLSFCTQFKADPPSRSDKYIDYSGEVMATEIIDGVDQKSKPLAEAIRAKKLEVVGLGWGRTRGLVVRVLHPKSNILWRVEVKQPTLAIPEKHGLTEASLRHHQEGFARFRPALAKLDSFRTSLRNLFARSPSDISTWFEDEVQGFCWSGRQKEFPWDADPKTLAQLPAAFIKKFLVREQPAQTLLRARLLAGVPLNDGHVRFLNHLRGDGPALDLDKVPKATKRYGESLAQLPVARSPIGVDRLLRQAKNADLAQLSGIYALYEHEALKFHQDEVAAAKDLLQPEDVVVHAFDGVTFLSTRDSAETIRIATPDLSAQKVAEAYEQDFNTPTGILGNDPTWLESASRNKRMEQTLQPGDFGFGYFAMLRALVEKLPPAPEGRKNNILLWTTPRLRKIDFATLYTLLNVAGVNKFARRDLRWFEIAEDEGINPRSRMRGALWHLRRLEKFPVAGAADILALTIPAESKEDGGEKEFNSLKYGLYLQGKLTWQPPRIIAWNAYQENTLDAVLKLKKTAGSIIKPPTLDAFVAAVKRQIEQHAGTAITITLLTHRQGEQEIVFFGQETIPLDDVVDRLIAARLYEKNVVFTVLACGFARNKHLARFLDGTEISLLVAPAEDVTVAAACSFQTLVAKHRKNGMSIIEAQEGARRERVKTLRERLKADPKLKLRKEELTLLRSVVRRSAAGRMAG